METTRVKDVMTKGVIGVDVSTPILEAAKEMERRDISSIVILDGGEPVGIVTEKDLVRRVLIGGLPLDTEVREIMSSPLITVEPDTELCEVSKLMADARIRRLPVRKGKDLVGIITATDIFEISPRCETEFVKTFRTLEDLLGKL
jgi:CBS domain-containing protein